MFITYTYTKIQSSVAHLLSLLDDLIPRNFVMYAAKVAVKVTGFLRGRATNKRAEILFTWSQVRVRFTSL